MLSILGTAMHNVGLVNSFAAGRKTNNACDA
jgi:hypothetical protein